MSIPPEVPPRAKRGCCVHYEAWWPPSLTKACRAGVVYAKLTGTEPGEGARLPCIPLSAHRLQAPVICNSRQEPTEEQIDAWRAYVEGSFGRIKGALAAVEAAHVRTGRWAGTIRCPTCGNDLRWSKARSNGHVHGRCETTGCVAWAQ